MLFVSLNMKIMFLFFIKEVIIIISMNELEGYV